jgi:hypothetical protein
MDVGQADPGYLGCGYAGLDHLALGALAGVEEQTFTVPAQQVPVVVPGAGGNLRRSSEDNEFTHGFVGNQKAGTGRIRDLLYSLLSVSAA